jgi:hypothetical protein
MYFISGPIAFPFSALSLKVPFFSTRTRLGWGAAFADIPKKSPLSKINNSPVFILIFALY